MRFGITRKVDALASKPDAPEETSTFDIASFKALETGLLARLAELSDDQRSQVINRAIDILRSRNAGWEAELEVRRITGLEPHVAPATAERLLSEFS